MIITATDFQLSVNEYFTKLMQGEEVIIERYGKKFAVLIPFDQYEEFVQSKTAPQAAVEQRTTTSSLAAPVSEVSDKASAAAVAVAPASTATPAPAATQLVSSDSKTMLTPEELAKLLKILLANS